MEMIRQILNVQIKNYQIIVSLYWHGIIPLILLYLLLYEFHRRSLKSEGTHDVE